MWLICTLNVSISSICYWCLLLIASLIFLWLFLLSWLLLWLLCLYTLVDTICHLLWFRIHWLEYITWFLVSSTSYWSSVLLFLLKSITLLNFDKNLKLIIKIFNYIYIYIINNYHICSYHLKWTINNF